MLNLVKSDEPILYSPSVPVVWGGGAWDDFFKELEVTMLLHNGIGISAVQVGRPLQLFVMLDVITNRTVYVCNPKLRSYSRKEITFEEGCLSFPGEVRKVSRPSVIKVTYIDGKNGRRVKRRLSGIEARVFLHEYDHLLGITFDEPSAY